MTFSDIQRRADHYARLRGMDDPPNPPFHGADSMAVRFLRENPNPGKWARFKLILSPRIVHATAETYIFPDGSSLDVVTNGPTTEYVARHPPR